MCPPYTSHQPLAIFCTAPTPAHLLRAWLHCHIWMCLSNHVSHCLEEFSPQTSPSGISYPMVGVPSMCPPSPINLWQYSTLHPHPLRARLPSHLRPCLSIPLPHSLTQSSPPPTPT